MLSMSSITQSRPAIGEPEAWPRRTKIFGIQIDAVSMDETVSIVRQWITEASTACRYVVTPNVDHVVLRKRLPERVAGSDVVPNLFASMDGVSPLRVYLLGAAPGVGVRAAANIQQRFPGVKVVGVDSPPIGFERHADENETILARIADAQPDLLVVGLGAPKQELWVHAHRHAIRAKVAICAGATIDFLAGEKRRAPKWLRCLGLEWLHRLCSEPKRLGRRYLKDGVVFPLIVWREMQASR
jgi:N-acetylglucosaminyldiphosphoundecaprenol N-acetyl-beta-D-mannosaminyltransferase